MYSRSSRFVALPNHIRLKSHPQIVEIRLAFQSKNLAWSPRRRSKSSNSRPSRGLGGASPDRSRSHHLRTFTLLFNIRRMNLDFFDRSSCKLDENHDAEFMSRIWISLNVKEMDGVQPTKFVCVAPLSTTSHSFIGCSHSSVWT